MLTHFRCVYPVKKAPVITTGAWLYIEIRESSLFYNLPVSPLSTRLR
jgi:hypothetical protein